MKRLLIAASLAAVTMSFGSASAANYEVTGSILVPTFSTPDTPAAEGGTYTRQGRCGYLAAKEAGDGTAVNGLVAWVVEMDESVEGNGSHEFSLTSDAGDAGVTFYEKLATCDGVPSVTGESFNAGNESGQIPWFSNYAIIVVEGAAAANFTFTVSESEPV